MSKFRYQVNIIWSNENNCYLVELPDFQTEVQRFFTDGDTYEEALKNAQEVLTLLVESYQAEGKTLPTPAIPQLAK